MKSLVNLFLATSIAQKFSLLVWGEYIASTNPCSQHLTKLGNAIAEFEKTLVTPNSRFDKFLKGDKTALTTKEQQGYALFKQNKCQTCHSGQAMGGLSFEVMGLKDDYFGDRGNITDVDSGRFNVTKDDNDMHRFKVPTLRNIALTAPYFHDASAKTLEQAVNDMALYQVGVKLSPDEIDKITAYLKTLTGEYNGKLLQ